MEENECSRVDFMNSMATDESVIFKKYINLYTKNKEKAIFLLEGVDDIDYYLPKIKEYFGEYDNKWTDMVCAGRDNVIQLIKDLSLHTKHEYKESIHFGVIDKDYNEVLDNPFPEKIYITPCYSIENFYISIDVFKRVLKFKFFLNETDEANKDFFSCLNNYKSRRNEFIDAVLELDKYLRCNRIMYEKELSTFKINARDLKLDNFITIDLNKVAVKSNTLDFLGKTIEEFDEESLKQSEQFYDDKKYDLLALMIRGKFMFHFFVHYLHKLKHDNQLRVPVLFVDSYTNSKKRGNDKINRKKTKLHVDRENSDLLSILSNYSDYPQCLRDFLHDKATRYNFLD